MTERFPFGPSTRPDPPSPREQRVSPDRPAAVQGAKRRSEGIRQIGAILHAKAVSATVVKPFGFATGDWEGSRCGIRTRIALQNPVAQVVVAILWSHGPFATPGQGGCSLGMHGSPPKRRDKKARRSAAGRPSRRFGPPRRSWGLTRGLTHCVRSRLRRELYHPQRSSETLRLACKIAPICLIPYLPLIEFPSLDLAP